MTLFWTLYACIEKKRHPLLHKFVISLHNYYLNKIRKKILNYEPNLITPKTMNEKILWLIDQGDLELKTKLTDKIRVKNWVASLIGEEHIAKTYAVCESLDELDWDKLPVQFVIKASHGCRMNIFVKNKLDFSSKLIDEAKKITQSWLKINYADFCGEIQYKDIPPKILVEEFIQDKSPKYRGDYSFHCFNGEPLFIEHNKDVEGNPVSFIYDLDGKQIDFVISRRFYKSDFVFPSNFKKMIEISRILSKNFRYVRVDLRDCKDKIIFGEMTFTPYAGCINFSNKEKDFEFGEKIIL